MADNEDDDFPLLDMDKEGGDAQDVKVEERLAVAPDMSTRKVWLVKVPKFLQERWAEQTQAGVHLATMRVYNPSTPGGKSKISLMLPEDAAYPTHDLPNEFDLNMAAEENEEGDKKRGGFVLSERKIEGGRVHPTLYSRIHHEASLQPNLHAPQYRALLRKRQELAAKPKRTLMRLDEDKLGAGQVAQMASGVAVSAAEKSKGGRFQVKAPPTKSLDKNTRLPQNELLDLIFPLFETHPYWTLKGLKEKTRQPETYLKEVMAQVGIMQKRGPYTGTWALMEMYKRKDKEVAPGADGGAKKEEARGEQGADASLAGPSGSGGYGGGQQQNDDDDESDEDEDMDEV